MESSNKIFQQNHASNDLQERLSMIFQRIFPPPGTSPFVESNNEEIITPEPELETRSLKGSHEFKRSGSLSAEQLLIEENILLRKVCSESVLLIEQLENEKRELCRKLETVQLANGQYYKTKVQLFRQVSELKRRLEMRERELRHLSTGKHDRRRLRSFASNAVLSENRSSERRQSRNRQRSKEFRETNGSNKSEESSETNDIKESPKPKVHEEVSHQSCDPSPISALQSHPKFQNLCTIECSSSQTLHLLKIKNRPKKFLGFHFDYTLQTGVVVQHVFPGSAADDAHMMAGDVIIEICGINVRNTSHVNALKIIYDCNEDLIEFKLLRNKQGAPPVAICTSTKVKHSNRLCLQKTISLRRRHAFMERQPKSRHFYGRQYAKDLLLYQNSNINLTIPRRIHIQHSLEKIQLLGGNAVGIFVHSIKDEGLVNCLQTGDQILEYNNVDLTQATAEDAAIELARPVKESVIVALFNIDGYNLIQESSIGDSFYIRAEFSRASINRSLEFKKGDILYVDDTLHDGKPGLWRAWKVNNFGEKIAWGVIPSRYDVENEIQRQQQEYYARDKFRGFSILAIFRPLRILFRQSNSQRYGYHKLVTPEENPSEKHTAPNSPKKDRVLASFTMKITDGRDCNNNKTDMESGKNKDGFKKCFKKSKKIESEAEKPSDKRWNSSTDSGSISYCRVNKIQIHAPRPVIIFGPFSNLLIERLVSNYPQMFRACKREFTQVSGTQKIHSATQNRLNTHSSFSIESIQESANQGLHPVIDSVENCFEYLQSKKLHPIIIGLRFKSPRHIKNTVNQWTLYDRSLGGRRISNNIAKINFKHQKQLEDEWRESVHDFKIVGGNNHYHMCQRIKQIVQEEQIKVIWQ